MCSFANVCSFRGSGDTCCQTLVKGAVEFLGTFLFSLAVCLTVNARGLFTEPAALGIGFALATLVFTWGHISGGHFNPAVTTACWVAGAVGVVTWAIYVPLQILGGILGGVVAAAVATETATFPANWPLFSAEGHEEGLLTEFLFTFLLCTAVLNTACTVSRKYEDNSFFGLAIGLVVLVGVLMTINGTQGASSGAFNPAIFLGANTGAKVFTKRKSIDTVLPDVEAKYWVAFLGLEFLAAILAGLFFALTEQTVAASSAVVQTSDSEEYTTEAIQEQTGGGYVRGTVVEEVQMQQTNPGMYTRPAPQGY